MFCMLEIGMDIRKKKLTQISQMNEYEYGEAHLLQQMSAMKILLNFQWVPLCHELDGLKDFYPKIFKSRIF